MAERKHQQPPTTAGGAWGIERVQLGLSLRALSKLCGIPTNYLSLIEQGRMIPTGKQYQAVAEAFRKVREGWTTE